MSTRAEHMAWCKQRALEYIMGEHIGGLADDLILELAKTAGPHAVAAAITRGRAARLRGLVATLTIPTSGCMTERGSVRERQIKTLSGAAIILDNVA